MVLFSIVLSFFCVLIFYCFNKRISVSPKPGMVYFHLLFLHELPVILEELISKFSGGSSPPDPPRWLTLTRLPLAPPVETFLRGPCHVNSLARTESFWVFSPGFSSLINNISNIKQSNLVLHFLKIENCLSFKSDFDRPWSSKCLPIAEYLCSPMRWCKCRAVYPT